MPVAIDVLSDMFFTRCSTPQELRKEREVVLEEIKMYDDSPDEVINDLFLRTLWRGANLGDPTIGFAETVARSTPDDLRAHMRAHYAPDTVVVAAAGNLDHDDFVELVGEAFARFGGACATPDPKRRQRRPTVTFAHNDTEQAYVMLGMRGLSMRDERRYTLSVLDTMLGGGMSSRLFQEVREKRGLAYKCLFVSAAYRGAGLFGVSAGTSPESVQECVDVIVDQIGQVRDGASPRRDAPRKSRSRGI